MKIKNGFILRDVGGKTFVVAVGERSREFKGMITLNETGKLIWQTLEKGATVEEVVNAILAEYECDDKALVESDVNAFIAKLEGDGILE
ncbi:MAG: PqqD family protein [Clostridia bacterium]|nr:PqqD family protein [Clostridia bacterium]